MPSTTAAPLTRPHALAAPPSHTPAHTAAGVLAFVLGAIAFAIPAIVPTTSLPLPMIGALTAALPAFALRGLGDYIGRPKPLLAGALLQSLALAGALLLPGLPVLWVVLAGLGAGVLLPASAGLAASGAGVAGTPTPRVLLPRRFDTPVADRSAHRAAVATATAALGLAGLAWALAVLDAQLPAIALAAIGLVLLGVAVVRTTRVGDPLGASESAGAVLVPGFAALALTTGAFWLASMLMPQWVAFAVAAVVGLLAVTVSLRSGRRSGRLAAAGSPSYRGATSVFDATAKPAPSMAAVARSAKDVQDAVATARAAGLGLRAHSTGHASGTSATFERDALLKVLVDEPVTVDAAARTARIPAGASWRDVVRAITPLGLGAPHGSSSHVGAVGYLLRGGLSAYGRATGVAANSVVSIEAVLADGSFVIVDADRDAELFWALRGGGGGLAIVTAVTVRLFELARVVTGTALFPATHAAELAGAWRAWCTEAPERITTTFRLLSFPGLPGLPKGMTNTPLVVVDGSAVAAHRDELPEAEAAALDLLSRLRAVVEPVVDSWKVASPYETPHTHMDPPIGIAHTGDTLILDDPSGDAVAQFVATADLRHLASLELRQLGGALGRRPEHGGAVSAFDGDLAYWGVGLHSKRSTEQQVRTALATVRSAIEPWSTGLIVPTFAPDASLPQRLFDDATRDRVQAVRERIDPDGLFARDVAPGAR